jgi:hypothetical protein
LDASPVSQILVEKIIAGLERRPGLPAVMQGSGG